VLGSWRDGLGGLSYEVTIPPAGMVFGSEFIVGETVTWVGHHIVTHVRQALAGQEHPANRIAQPGAGWRDRGDGTAAIMCGAELVASFNAQFLVPDEYPSDAPPDRTDETQRNVEEGAATLQTDEEGGERLMNWVDRKWLARLDAWWLFGEPVFWCEHITSDDDEPLLEWFMRFPAAMACDQCADRIREPLLAGEWVAACDSCGEESVETVYARTPGMSVIANYELCRSCSGTFTGREG
jgi:hypothetical protein